MKISKFYIREHLACRTDYVYSSPILPTGRIETTHLLSCSTRRIMFTLLLSCLQDGLKLFIFYSVLQDGLYLLISYPVPIPVDGLKLLISNPALQDRKKLLISYLVFRTDYVYSSPILRIKTIRLSGLNLLISPYCLQTHSIYIPLYIYKPTDSRLN